MPKKLDELLEQEKQLEKERMIYLDADDNRGAKRIEKKLYRVRDLIDIELDDGSIEVKKKLDIYRSFVKELGMTKEFERYEKERRKQMKWED